MKTFIISIAVMLLLLALIGVNIVFIHRTANALEERIGRLSIDDEAALTDLEAYWKKQKALIGLSVSSEVIRTIDEHMAEIHSAMVQGSAEDLDLATRLALCAIEQMRHNEECAIDNLL
ncbi:MAG: hypothetical protein IJX39_02870 [Clostridia bacterium]|nr:hypothetical protein [Clostridia bacterium]